MAKRTVKQKVFKKFKEYCEFYADYFELSEYCFNYSFYDDTDEDFDDDVYANIHMDCDTRCVDVCLFYDPVLKDDKTCESIAKHEMLHAVVGELAGMAHNRYISENDILSAEEALVNKLSRLT